MFNRKLKEYTNELPKNDNVKSEIMETENEIQKLKEENNKMKEKLKGEYWIDNQRFDLEKDKEKIKEILKNNSSIIIRKRLGNIKIYDDFINDCILLHDTLTNKSVNYSPPTLTLRGGSL